MDSYNHKYEVLRRSYIERLQREGMQLTEILKLLQAAILHDDDLQQMRNLSHGLAGSGSVFGFPAVSEAGAKVDQFTGALIQSGVRMADIPVDQFHMLSTMLENLCAACLNRAEVEPVSPQSNIEPSTAAGSYVLLVDDDAALAALLSTHLKERGIHVVTAVDGTEALKILGRQSPDLVILDVMMPGISGHDVLKHLKYDPKFSLIPAIMMSAQEQEKEAAFRLGAIDYITKPVQPDMLIKKLEQILEAAPFQVVIADNDEMLLDLLQQKFHQRGFKVSVESDGKRAWDHIFKTLPDLVILDRMMPGMDGMAVLKNMRTEPETKDIPVIVLSARKEERDIQIGMQFGAQDYVVKPCDPDELLNRSLSLLHSHGSEHSVSVKN